MVDRIGNNQEYKQYVSPNAKKPIETQEKFSLDQTGISSSESDKEATLYEKEKKDKEDAENTIDISHYSEQEIQNRGGVILELSEEKSQILAGDPNRENATKWSNSKWLQRVQGWIKKGVEVLANIWNIVWNSPADRKKTEVAKENVVPEDLEDSEVSGETFEKTVEDFLSGTQAGEAAKNTDILSYYDKTGKMVQVIDKNRILKGK